MVNHPPQHDPCGSAPRLGRLAPRLSVLKSFLTRCEINPILKREFVRYTRHGRFWFLLFFLLLICSSILCLVWSEHWDADPQVPVGRNLFYALLVSELGVVILILPGIVAQTIIMERDHNTYPLLLTTPLSPAKVICGKLFSTLGVMMFLLTSTFPLLGICVARGGVSPWEMLAGGFYLLFFSFMVATLALYYALNALHTLQAILRTQFTFFLVFFIGGATLAFWIRIVGSLVSAFLTLLPGMKPLPSILSQPAIWIGIYASIGTVAALGFTLWILRKCPPRLRYIEPQVSHPRVRKPIFRFRFPLHKSSASSGSSTPPLDEWNYEGGMNPFYIRERQQYQATRTRQDESSWFPVILVSHVLFLLTPIQGGKWVALVCLTAVVQMVFSYAAPLFAGERERGTWDLLCTSISQSRPLLHGKLAGAFMQCMPKLLFLFWYPLLAAYGLFLLFRFLSPSMHPLITWQQTICYAAVLAVQWVFLLLMTTFFSLYFHRIKKVMLSSFTGVGIGYILPLFAGLFLEQLKMKSAPLFIYCLSPVYMIHAVPHPFLTMGEGMFWFHLFSFHLLVYISLVCLMYFFCIRKLKYI